MVSRPRAHRSRLLPALAFVAMLAAPIATGAGTATAGKGGTGGSGGGNGQQADKGELKTVVTGRRAELRPTVPVANRAGQKTKSVLSVKLPDLERGERVRFNGEVTITITCVDQIDRCIGRSYNFDPHMRARIVLADEAGQVGKDTVQVSKAVSLTCQQTRPNRNHHCPLTIQGGSFTVKQLKDLPCKPTSCRLNMAFDAWHRKARSNEFVVVGADQPDGSTEGGKARLSAVVSKGKVDISKRSTRDEVNTVIPASFEGGKTVVYSQRLDNLQAGDVLVVRSDQYTAITGLPYFVSNQIVVSTRRNSYKPSTLTRRIVSRSGLVTETTGFNCTLGPSAYRSPCHSIKAGMATIEGAPKTKGGKPKPLYVNLVTRSFPKLAQARGYPAAQVQDGGGLIVRRLRLAD